MPLLCLSPRCRGLPRPTRLYSNQPSIARIAPIEHFFGRVGHAQSGHPGTIHPTMNNLKTVGLLAFMSALVVLVAAASPSEVAPVLEAQGFFVEAGSNADPDAVVVRATGQAWLGAAQAAQSDAQGAGEPPREGLWADTIVLLDGRILGKPADAAFQRDVIERALALLDADGPTRTISSTWTYGPAPSRPSGTPKAPSKKRSCQGSRRFEPAPWRSRASLARGWLAA